MKNVLIDSNVLLDIFTEDPDWLDWSSQAMSDAIADHIACINPIIYSEISVRFERIEDLEAALPTEYFTRLPLPWEAAFLAGKCFLKYRQRGGKRTTTLPDFFIGAHAAVSGMTLLTRDASRYRTYFPTLKIIAPQ